MAYESNSLPVELRRGFYEAVFRRRDIRKFLPDPIPDEVLARVLVAAHHAASVGFTQPWNFLIVKDLHRRRLIKRVFEEERAINAVQFDRERRDKFLALKLEGILETPLNLVVTCERGRFGPGVLGRTAVDDVEVYSTCLAVQNLWLAARAEGLGVGWVSILRNDAIRNIFRIPEAILPVAYLCMGYVEAFPPRPMLEEVGWAERLSPRKLLRFDSWENDVAETGNLSRLVEDAAIWRDIFSPEAITDTAVPPPNKAKR
ncbi:MAG TPA: 5,6-dimethylbenzimidazole synthase [Candidatus Binataceae bacterium]|nr:5,6-dimethylbenzimidazole synthase [Candidatus Binataceae bacterium]